jgi:hypothetical protein
MRKPKTLLKAQKKLSINVPIDIADRLKTGAAKLPIGVRILSQDTEPKGGLNINDVIEKIGVKAWVGIAIQIGPKEVTVAKLKLHDVLMLAEAHTIQ